MSKFPRHVGGGWVETSDGRKHRGWDRAHAHQNSIDAARVDEIEVPRILSRPRIPGKRGAGIVRAQAKAARRMEQQKQQKAAS